MNLKLDLPVESVNLILEGLGNMPFIRVAPLIQEIQTQAQPQLAPQLVPAPEGKAEGDGAA